MSESPSTTIISTPTVSEIRHLGESKPIKLRSACNVCFIAKVRCDGNKEGCNRCAEKRLGCTYSESRVGKVVGKRRKRPLPESAMSESKPTQWDVTTGSATLPSPAPTNISEPHSNQNCVPNDWTSLISYEGQSPLDFSNCEERFLNLEMAQASSSSTADDMCDTMRTGIPTPFMSPPEMRYVWPSDLERSTGADQSSIQPTSHRVSPQRVQPMPMRRSQAFTEDDESVCIKLLAHLKRFSQQQQSSESVLSLVQKTNTALRRLLRSRTIRTDYTCHLLLTNIVLRLASSCEQLVLVAQQQQNTQPESEFVHESYLVDDDSDSYNDQKRHDRALHGVRPLVKNAITESTIINAGIGDLLKRKPLNGFQVLGRQESTHVEIDLRLQRVLAALA